MKVNRGRQTRTFLQVVGTKTTAPPKDDQFPILKGNQCKENKYRDFDQKMRIICQESKYVVPYILARLGVPKLSFRSAYGILNSYIQDLVENQFALSISLEQLLWDISKVFQEKFFSHHNVKKFCSILNQSQLDVAQKKRLTTQLRVNLMIINLSRHVSLKPCSEEPLLTENEEWEMWPFVSRREWSLWTRPPTPLCDL